MALRPGGGGGGSFMFPVAGGLGPPQGMMSMQHQPQQQQQGYGMVAGMQPNMPSMMGMSFGPQIPTGPMAMQGGMTMGQMAAAGMAYMGQPTYMGMRPPTSQYTADIQKQFAEEQQRRYEHQQKILEEDRKRRQFEEQKQKLRLLSSVKPKTGEKSRDDALEAIKGNLDGFTREAKMHPTPVSHPTKTGHSMPSHSAVSHPHPPAFHDDDEFCDFIQGPADAPGPSTLSQTFQSSQPAAQARVLPSDQSGSLAHPFPSVHDPASSALLGTIGQIPMNPVTTTSQTESIKGVGVFPSQDPIQPVLPHWVYNDGLVPDLYKKVLETTMTPSGIDTTKLYPILMASGLPRETLGQIWGMANRTTPGQLIKEELYIVLAMIAMTQRGIPAMSLDAFSQLQAAPVPTLSGSPLSLPPTVPPQPMISMLAAPGVSVPLSIGQPVMGLNMTAPVTSTAPPVSTGFMMSFPASQAAKPEEDDFQDFQDASKSDPIDDSFSDFQGDTPGTFPKSANSQTSAPCVITPVSVTMTSSSDKYAVFTQMTTNKSEAPLPSFTEFGDKYSVFRELEQTAESKPVGDGFEDFRSAGADDGFTDFKTADTISPLETSEKDKPFTASFPTAPSLKQQLQSQQQMQTKLPLKVSDLDLFSLTSSGENKSLSLSQESVSSSFPLPLSSSSTSSNAAGKSSTLVDDFGDFSIFGDSSSAPSSGRNDFADFMAFTNTTGFSEQKSEDKYNALKQEGGSVLTSNSYVSVNENGQHHLSSVSDKYDVFKQLSLEGFEEQKDSTFSSMKSDDDFADFQTGKFSSGLSNSDKVLIDKVAAFRHAKEDSASVKSLDLPSIGGSSIGKEDSEDALSVQFDMKLSDVGGDLKHVMSDSSLDLPPVSGQHPPAADMDDLKFLSLTNNNNSSAINNLGHCETAAVDQPSAFFLSSETMSSSTTSILQRKETSFGSSENITMTVTSKVITCLNEDSSTTDNFDEFTDFKDHTLGTAKQIMDSEFGNFAGTVPDVEISLSTLNQDGVLPSFASNGVPSDLEKNDSKDDFGEFQREKPKISKFDFLVASSQGKIKSSEEMIKNELATFDLSVQGSHKRSLSLGDREINHTVHPPPQEQGFRDRSNTLNERPALPIIRDRYKDLTGEVEESERYAYEWQRCLESVLQVIKKANDTLNGISSSSICTEVIQSTQGMEYLLGVVEVYRVARRVELGIKAAAVCSEKLQHLLKDIERVWNNLIGFMSLASLTPDDSSLDFSTCMLRPGIKNAKELACGVCLLNVESRSKAFDSEIDCFKLAYGGHQYHASCANFWINCVEPKPPGLVLPDLL